MRILIVEDERTLCDTIARSLRNLAYKIGAIDEKD